MRNKIMCLLLVCASLFAIFILNSNAIETEFDFLPLDENEKKTFLSNVSFSEVAHSESKNPIESFDVNNNGIVAIVHSNYNDKAITFLNSDGLVLGRLEFSSDGDVGVKWEDDDNLLVYFVRSDVIATVSQKGEILELHKITTSSEKYYEWREQFRFTTKEINEVKYSLKNDFGFFNMFASSYSQLILTSSDGNEQKLYDASSLYLERVVVGFVAVCFFIIIVTFVVIRLFITSKNKET